MKTVKVGLLTTKVGEMLVRLEPNPAVKGLMSCIGHFVSMNPVFMDYAGRIEISITRGVDARLKFCYYYGIICYRIDII